MSVSLSVLFLLCVAAGLSRACPEMCTGESCSEDPGPCKDGEVVVCGRRLCARGPGEPCGGSFNKLGLCGAGMHCSKKKLGMSQGHCFGCSTERLINGVKPMCAIWSHDAFLK